MKYVISQCYLMTGQILNYNVAVYIFVQSEEEYSLIWKAKPIAIEKNK